MTLPTLTYDDLADLLDRVAVDIGTIQQPKADDPDHARLVIVVNLARSAVHMQAAWWRAMGRRAATPIAEPRPFKAFPPRRADLS